MRLNKKDQVASVRFDSLADLLESKPMIKENEIVEKRLSSENSRTFHSDWFGLGRGHQQVISDAVNGNPEIYEALKERQRSLQNVLNKEPMNEIVSLPKRKRKRVKADQGDALDIHRVYQGQLDKAWDARVHVEMEKNQRLYTIFVDVGGLAGIGFSSSLWRGVVALQVADDLIRAGKTVKIIVGASAEGVYARNSIKTVTTDIVVKDYNEPLSMERLAAMSNIGFHRVFNFKSRCYIDARCNPNMGYTSSYLRNTGPLEDTGVPQDISHYIYVGQSNSRHEAIQNLENIYKGLK